MKRSRSARNVSSESRLKQTPCLIGSRGASPMTDQHDNTSTFDSSSRVTDAIQRASSSDLAVRPRQMARTEIRSENWDRRSERWGCLMTAAQAGDSHAYEQLLRELDA